MKNTHTFQKLTTKLIAGLGLSFALALSALASQNSPTAATTQEDGILETVIIGGQTSGSPTLTQAVAPISQVLQDFGKNQNITATNNSQTKSLPQSTAHAITADELSLTSPVLDYAKVLSTPEKEQLTSQLYKLYQDRLAQAALVIVPTTNGMPIFDYAMAVAKRWGLGDKQADDGILIVVAINDRTMYIVTGYGVEGVLPDAAIKRIIREDITPSFKIGAYAQGLSAGIARIDERLRADPEMLAKADQTPTKQKKSMDSSVLFVLAWLLGIVLSAIFGRLLGASVAAGGFVLLALINGLGFFKTLILAGVIWVGLLLFRSNGGSGSGSGGFSSGGFGGGGR